jgi:hypothetical protein
VKGPPTVTYSPTSNLSAMLKQEHSNSFCRAIFKEKDIDLWKMILDIKDNDTKITGAASTYERVLASANERRQYHEENDVRFIRRCDCSATYG